LAAPVRDRAAQRSTSAASKLSRSPWNCPSPPNTTFAALEKALIDEVMLVLASEEALDVLGEPVGAVDHSMRLSSMSIRKLTRSDRLSAPPVHG
jgi:hypothetical protein